MLEDLFGLFILFVLSGVWYLVFGKPDRRLPFQSNWRFRGLVKDEEEERELGTSLRQVMALMLAMVFTLVLVVWLVVAIYRLF